LPWKSIVSAAYVGRRGLHLQREADINQPTTAVVAANPGVNIDALRPYKGYNYSIRQTDNVASSLYKLIAVDLEPPFCGWTDDWGFLHSVEDYGQWLEPA